MRLTDDPIRKKFDKEPTLKELKTLALNLNGFDEKLKEAKKRIRRKGKPMKHFIKVCESSYGTRTCIYHYVNSNLIAEIHIEKSKYGKEFEATLINGMRVIITYAADIISLIGKKEWKRLKEEEWKNNDYERDY